MIVYNKINGSIIMDIPNDQTIENVFFHYPQEYKVNLDTIFSKEPLKNLNEYVVINNKIKKRSQQELDDLMEYGKVLTKEERILESMKPSASEVEEAEMTIKILSILEGVI